MEERGLTIDFKIRPLTFVMLEKRRFKRKCDLLPSCQQQCCFGFLYENTSSE